MKKLLATLTVLLAITGCSKTDIEMVKDSKMTIVEPPPKAILDMYNDDRIYGAFDKVTEILDPNKIIFTQIDWQDQKINENQSIVTAHGRLPPLAPQYRPYIDAAKKTVLKKYKHSAKAITAINNEYKRIFDNMPCINYAYFEWRIDRSKPKDQQISMSKPYISERACTLKQEEVGRLPISMEKLHYYSFNHNDPYYIDPTVDIQPSSHSSYEIQKDYEKEFTEAAKKALRS